MIPSRCAASVASVDLPVPVAPPTSRTTGSSRCCSACRRRRRRIVRPASGSPSTSAAISASRSRSSSSDAALDHVRVGAPGELIGSGRRQPGRRERARHQPFRPRRAFVAAERQRCEIAALAHTPTAAARDRLGRQPLELDVEVGLAGERHDVVRREDDGDPEPIGLLGHDVDRGGLDLDDEHVGVEAARAPPSASRSARLPETCDDVGAVTSARDARRSARAAPAGAVPKNATRRPRTSLERPRRSTARTTGTPGRVELAECLGEAACASPSSAIVIDDEIGEQRAVRVQVAGRDGRVLVGADDEDPAVGGDRRDRGAAAVEHDQVGVELLREPGARERRWRVPTAPASPPPQRRQPTVGRPVSAAVSRWSDAAWRPGAREREQVGDRRPHLDELGLGGPAAPHRDDDDAAVARERREPTWPVTAVLPTRLPVPITASDGVADRLEARRVEPEVGAFVRHAERERPRGEPEPLRRPEHGLVGEVEDDVRARTRRSPPRARPRAGRRSPRRRAASRCRRRAPQRRSRTATPRAHRGPPARSAPRRSRRSPSRARRHLGLDPAGVLLVLERVGRELDDPLLPVERMAAPDVDVAAR